MPVGELGVYFCLFIALYFEVFLFISFFEKKPASKTAERPKNFPTVSMLVPSYNEEKTLRATVESLLALDYPKEKLDIVIIDDGSTDCTREIGEHLAQTYSAQGRKVRFFHKKNGGKYTALNWGIKHSQGELVGCLDADSFVASDGLIEAVKKLESEPNIMALTPAMKVHRPRNMLELMQSVEYTFGIFYKKMFDNLAAINVLPGPFSIYRRAVFEKIGLFRRAYNTEDMEITFRMHAHGLKIVNAHTAFVYTTVPRTLRALIKQRTRWSQGFLQNSRDYSYMYFNPRFGNFGMLILPFSLTAFFAGLYMAAYTLFRAAQTLSQILFEHVGARLPLQISGAHLTWYYINTSTMTVLIAATVCMLGLSIMLGQRIAKTELGLKSVLSYFLLFGFVAPVWLARAAWGAALARESRWR